eukprot:5819490-Pleurochrysis_carterae.AAC.1
MHALLPKRKRLCKQKQRLLSSILHYTQNVRGGKSHAHTAEEELAGLAFMHDFHSSKAEQAEKTVHPANKRKKKADTGRTFTTNREVNRREGRTCCEEGPGLRLRGATRAEFTLRRKKEKWESAFETWTGRQGEGFGYGTRTRLT